jgi:hypothetical protein
MGELIGELHCDAAAQGVTDDGDCIDVEDAEQVPHPVGVGGDRVVRPRLVGTAVAEQIGGDHGEPAGQPAVHGPPGGGVVADAVNQQQCRTRSGDPERAPVAVDGLEAKHRLRVDPRARYRSWGGLARGHGIPCVGTARRRRHRRETNPGRPGPLLERIVLKVRRRRIAGPVFGVDRKPEALLLVVTAGGQGRRQW